MLQCPIIEDYILSSYCYLCTLAFGMNYVSHVEGIVQILVIANLNLIIFLNFFSRVCYNRSQKVSIFNLNDSYHIIKSSLLITFKSMFTHSSCVLELSTS